MCEPTILTGIDWKDIARQKQAEIEGLERQLRDLPADLLHPEFGTEWREPDGVIYKATKDLRAENERLRRQAAAFQGWRGREVLEARENWSAQVDALTAERDDLQRQVDAIKRYDESCDDPDCECCAMWRGHIRDSLSPAPTDGEG